MASSSPCTPTHSANTLRESPATSLSIFAYIERQPQMKGSELPEHAWRKSGARLLAVLPPALLKIAQQVVGQVAGWLPGTVLSLSARYSSAGKEQESVHYRTSNERIEANSRVKVSSVCCYKALGTPGLLFRTLCQPARLGQHFQAHKAAAAKRWPYSSANRAHKAGRGRTFHFTRYSTTGLLSSSIATRTPATSSTSPTSPTAGMACKRMLPASLCDAHNTADRRSAGLLVLTRRWTDRREAGKPAARQGKAAGA